MLVGRNVHWRAALPIRSVNISPMQHQEVYDLHVSLAGSDIQGGGLVDVPGVYVCTEDVQRLQHIEATLVSSDEGGGHA
jgi:hypothetical protein